MMNRINDIQARELMARFLSAETTLAEERQLRDYFAAGNVAPDLAPMAEMMAWYNQLSDQGTSESAASTRTASVAKSPSRWLARITAVAASVALIFALAWSMSLSSGAEVPEDLAYEGSYVIVNGQKITDVSLIFDQLKWAESYAQSLSTHHSPLPTPSPLDDLLQSVDNPVARQLIIETLTM